MRLHDNWREILRKAWSIRFAILAMVFSIMREIVPLYADLLPRHVFAILTVVALLGVLVARIIWQKDV
jgi:hypothetical protein